MTHVLPQRWKRLYTAAASGQGDPRAPGTSWGPVGRPVPTGEGTTVEQLGLLGRRPKPKTPRSPRAGRGRRGAWGELGEPWEL